MNIVNEVYNELPENLKNAYIKTIDDISFYKKKFKETGNTKYQKDINTCTRTLENLNEIISDKKIKELIYEIGQISGTLLKGIVIGLLKG